MERIVSVPRSISLWIFFFFLEMDGLRVLSLNAKGLNTPEKRKMLLHDLKASKTDIAFIQETHFRANKVPVLKIFS